MGHTLKIEFGTSNIDLTAGVYSIKTYVPQFASGDAETVTESAQIIIQAASVATLQSAIRDIEEYFSIAKRRRQTRIGNRVFITFQGSGAATKYRSELYSIKDSVLPGRVTINPMWMQNVHWDDFVAQVQVTWERKNYWEANTEVELSLANQSQAKATGGCTIYNPNTANLGHATTISFTNATSRISDSGNGMGVFAANDVINVRGSTSNDGIYTVSSVAGDGSYLVVHQTIVEEVAGDDVYFWDIQNYVDISSTDVSGSLPSPLGFYFTSETAGDELESFWIYANTNLLPFQFPHVLDSDDSDTTPTDTASALCVSALYNQYNVTTSYAKITGWTLPAQMLTVAAGGYFRILARFFDTTDITNVKLGVKILSGTTVLYTGGQIAPDDTYASTEEILREIDTIQLPPMPQAVQDPADLTLQLWGISTTGSTETIKLDCLFLLPTSSWLKLKSMVGVVQNAGVSEYPYEEQRHQTVSGASVPDIVGVGGPIMAFPGRDMRIYFNYHTDTNAVAEIARELEVKAYYRPRVLTV